MEDLFHCGLDVHRIRNPSKLLHNAITAGCSNVVELLLNHFTQNDLQGTYLSFCCDPLRHDRGYNVRFNHTLLTEAVCHVNQYTSNPTWHPRSTLSEREHIVELLIQKGGLDPNGVPAGKSITEYCLPLMHAITPLHNVNVVKILLQAGASPLKMADIKYSCSASHLKTHIDERWNSLHLACSRFGSVKLVETILESFTSSLLDRTKKKVLHDQFSSTTNTDAIHSSASLTLNCDITDLVNSQTQKGMTSLMIAASYSEAEIIEKLLLHKADVNVMAQYSCSSHHTMFGGTSPVWESALTLCINTCLQNSPGIHYVPRCVKLLLEHNPWRLRQLTYQMSCDAQDPIVLAIARWRWHHPAVFEMLYLAGFSTKRLRSAFRSAPRPVQYSWMKSVYDNRPLSLTDILDLRNSEHIEEQSNPLLDLYKRIIAVLHETPSLKQLCRICLRDNLREEIHENVKKLVLPLRLQKYLLLPELQTILDEYMQSQVDDIKN